MQQDHCKDKSGKRRKARTWTEAAKLVLEMFPKTPMTHKEIFGVVRSQGLKDVSGPASLACLNAMLHAHSRGSAAMFYRVAGANSVFGLTTDIPECATRLEIDEEESDADDDDSDDTIGEKKQSSDSDKSLLLQKCAKEKVLYVKFPTGYKPPNYPVVNLESSNLFTSSSCDRVGSANSPSSNSLTSMTETVPSFVSTREMRSSQQNGLLQWGETRSGKTALTSKWNGQDKNKGNKSVTIHLTLPATESGLTSPVKVSHHSHNHHQKAVKHALRQQQKRRRRNTAIAASGGSINPSTMAPPPPPAPLPRIIMKPLVPPPTHPSAAVVSSYPRRMLTRPTTSSLNSAESKNKIPPSVFSEPVSNRRFKPRKRNQKKLSTAAQIAQTKKGCIDLETPDSILVHTELRALLNKHTFASLPPAYQYQLVQLLPPVDRLAGSDCGVRLGPSALSNEFFSFACQEWWERLSEGEFTHENQLKRKWDEERERGKLDPWKLKHFEPVWSQKKLPDSPEPAPKSSNFVASRSSTNPKTTTETVESKTPSKSSTVIQKHVPALKLKPLLRKNLGIASILKPRNGENNLVASTLNSAGGFSPRKELKDPESSNSSSSSSSESSSTSSASESRATPDMLDTTRIPSANSTSSSECEPASASSSIVEKLISERLSSDLTRKRKTTEPSELILTEKEDETSKKIKLVVPSSDDSLSAPLPDLSVPSQHEVVKPEKSVHSKPTKDSQHVSRHKPVIRTTFTSSSGSSMPGVVPPITIRSVPVSSSSRSGSSGGRSSDGINMERSYQICQAVFESSRNRSQFLQTGLHIKHKDTDETTVASTSTVASAPTTCANMANLIVTSTALLAQSTIIPTTTAASLNLISTSGSERLFTNKLELQPSTTIVAATCSSSAVMSTSVTPCCTSVAASSSNNSTFSVPMSSCSSPIFAQAEQSGRLVEAELILPQESIAMPCSSAKDKSPAAQLIVPSPPPPSPLPVPAVVTPVTSVEQSMVVLPTRQATPVMEDTSNQPRQQVIVTAEETIPVVQNATEGGSAVSVKDTDGNGTEKVGAPVVAVELLTPCHTPQAISVELEGGHLLPDKPEENPKPDTTVHDSINKYTESGTIIVERNEYHHPENHPFEPVLLPDGTIPVLVVQDLSPGQLEDGSHLLSALPSSLNPQRPQSAPISVGADKNKSMLQRSSSFQDFHVFEIPDTLQQPFTSIRKRLNQYEPLTATLNSLPSAVLTATNLNSKPNTSGAPVTTHSSGKHDAVLSTSVAGACSQPSATHAKNITNLLINHNPSVYQNSTMQQQSHNVPSSLPVSNASMYPQGSILITHGQNALNHQYQVNDSRSLVTVVPSIPPFPVMSAGFNFTSANGVSLISADDRSPNHFTSPIYVNSGTAVAPQNNLIGVGGVPTSEAPATNGGNCACNLKAMVMCCKCGAFCHDDCIGPSKLCVTCLIR